MITRQFSSARCHIKNDPSAAGASGPLSGIRGLGGLGVPRDSSVSSVFFVARSGLRVIAMIAVALVGAP